jgi:class 3 adenylate cyclase
MPTNCVREYRSQAARARVRMPRSRSPCPDEHGRRLPVRTLGRLAPLLAFALLLLCAATAPAGESFPRLAAWQTTERDDPTNASVSLDTATWEAVTGALSPPPTSGNVRWIRHVIEPTPVARQLLLSTLPRDLQIWIDGELVHSEQHGERRNRRHLRVPVPPNVTVIALRLEDDAGSWRARQSHLGADLAVTVGTAGAVDEIERASINARQSALWPNRLAAILLGVTALLASFVYQQRRALTAFAWFAATSALIGSWFGLVSAVDAGWLPYRWYSTLDPTISDLAISAGVVYSARLANRPIPHWMAIGVAIELVLVAVRLLIGPDSRAVVPIAIDQVLLAVLAVGSVAVIVPAARAGNRPAIAVSAGGAVCAGSMSIMFVSSWLGHPLPGAIQVAAAALVTSMAVAMVFLLVDHARNLDLTRDAAMRFVPQSFLDHLGHTHLPDVRRGDAVERTMTVLFSDIREFTTISEGLEPSELFGLVNDYLSYVVPEIERNGGFVDKYVGDAIMALFDDPRDAVRATVACERALARYNADYPDRPSLRAGIGLHTGRLTLGTLGSEQRLSCTVIGDTVNVASRLEGLTKQYGVSPLLSADTAVGLEKSEIRSLDSIRVDGREEPVEVFTLKTAPTPPVPPAGRPGGQAAAS